MTIEDVKQATDEQLQEWENELPHEGHCARRGCGAAECTCIRFEVVAELYSRELV
jgi:hypothetical protein